jgi:hypothetical protein
LAAIDVVRAAMSMAEKPFAEVVKAGQSDLYPSGFVAVLFN